jgi:hypothetical protein
MKNLFSDAQNRKAIFSALANVVHEKYMTEKSQHNDDTMLLLMNIFRRTNLRGSQYGDI